jgi:hypothetical protein
LRVTRGAHHCGGLLGRVDHRHQQALHAQVEVLFDQHLTHMAVAHGHARHGVAGGVGGDGLQLRQDALRVVGGVLAVQQQPIKTGARAYFGGVGAGQPKPQPNLGLLLRQCVFEQVGGGLHKSTQTKVKVKRPSGP